MLNVCSAHSIQQCIQCSISIKSHNFAEFINIANDIAWHLFEVHSRHNTSINSGKNEEENLPR